MHTLLRPEDTGDLAPSPPIADHWTFRRPTASTDLDAPIVWLEGPAFPTGAELAVAGRPVAPLERVARRDDTDVIVLLGGPTRHRARPAGLLGAVRKVLAAAWSRIWGAL